MCVVECVDVRLGVVGLGTVHAQAAGTSHVNRRTPTNHMKRVTRSLSQVKPWHFSPSSPPSASLVSLSLQLRFFPFISPSPRFPKHIYLYPHQRPN